MSAFAPHPTQESTLALVREALDEGQELIKLEVALAKKEAEAELALLRGAAIAWAIAVLAGSVGTSMALVAAAIASNAPLPFAIVAAAVFFVVAGIGASVAYRRTPRSLLARTRQRLEDDVRRIGGRGEWRLGRTTR